MDGIDRLERADPAAWVENLAQLHLPDGDASIEGRTDCLLRNRRAQLGDSRRGLLCLRVGGVEISRRGVVGCAQRARALEVRASKLRVSEPSSELRLFGGGVQLDEHLSAANQGSGLETDLADRAWH